MDNAIEVSHVTVKYNLMEEKVNTLKEYIVKIFKGKLLYNEFIGLKDVSFSVKKGDILGVVGFNGAGKSTLLKILAGVLQPSEGSVVVKGTIAPLIEVGAGFDPELTAKENIFLNGSILGHTRKFLESKMQEIIEFAELEAFVDVPIKNFSSGMYARLGFAIATIVKPDILIVDEVLSVGDFKFQQKCEERINEMIKQGTTIVLVSHDSELIRRVCTKAILLENGQLIALGNTQYVLDRFID